MTRNFLPTLGIASFCFSWTRLFRFTATAEIHFKKFIFSFATISKSSSLLPRFYNRREKLCAILNQLIFWGQLPGFSSFFPYSCSFLYFLWFWLLIYFSGRPTPFLPSKGCRFTSSTYYLSFSTHICWSFWNIYVWIRVSLNICLKIIFFTYMFGLVP